MDVQAYPGLRTLTSKYISLNRQTAAHACACQHVLNSNTGSLPVPKLCASEETIEPVTNVLFTSVMHVYDDCSTVHASISGKKVVLHFKYIFALHTCSGPIAYVNAGYACTITASDEARSSETR
ncbi:hypothetical protein FKM82_013226 [Ascaphus truei]